MTEPLEGFKVVEMSIAVQGPAAALYLRDMGAEVIKVEPPQGDSSRYSRGRDNETPPDTLSPQFVAVNRGKRSVCLDVKTDTGMKALMALLETADVFLTNYREPALERLGLSHAALKQQFPNLIYASVNGFGPAGPDAHKAMLDGVAVTRGGLAHHTGYADREPSLLGAVVVDTAGALQLALGVMTALLARERFGKAQRVQTSALGACLWLQQWELTHTAMTGANLKRDGNHHPLIKGPYGVYHTSDGGAITLAQTMTEEAWDAFCIFADVLDLATDPRYRQTPGLGMGESMTEEDSNEVRRQLADAFAKKTTQEWVAFFYSRPDIIWERVRSWQDVLEDEQNLANNYFTEVQVENLGACKTVGQLVGLSETPGSAKGNPPQLGEGNDEILAAAGLSKDEIAAIKHHADETQDQK